jgi:NADP-dependent alcohol dehydrogenase
LQNGVVDAYTHVLEQYLTYPMKVLQDHCRRNSTNFNPGPEVVETLKIYALASNFMELYDGAERINPKGVPSDYTYDWS